MQRRKVIKQTEAKPWKEFALACHASSWSIPASGVPFGHEEWDTETGGMALYLAEFRSIS